MFTKSIRYSFLLCALLTQMMYFGISPQTVFADNSSSQESEDPTLIISAIQITGGTGHTQEDFVELFNPTSQPFDLNGYRLVKRTAAGTTDTAIQSWSDSKIVLPYHFFLWANSNFSGIAATPESTSSGTLADNNGVALRYGANDSGEVIDSAAWGSTANGFDPVSSVNPPANQSLSLEDLFDSSSSFKLQTSSPRNSSIELLPELIEEPEPTSTEPPVVEDPAPIDPATDDPAPAGDPPVENPDPTVPPVVTPDPDPEPQPETVNIKITEILPNPVGSDSGFEQVELYNAGNQTVDLANFKLDDVAPTDPISSNAYTLPETEVQPDSYIFVSIPLGKFSLNNTGGDIVTLFNASNEDLDSVFYSGTAEEGVSYSYFSNGWQWAPSTFGEENGEPPAIENEDDSTDDDSTEDTDLGDYDNSGLQITEIYPDPVSGASEFVEIYNSGDESAQLSVVSLWIGTRHKFLPEHELKPGDYYVISQADLPIQLRNSGQDLKLLEGTTELNSVSYPLAIEGASYAQFEDGFLWTTQVTQGEANILQLPEVVKKEVTAVAAKTAVSKTTKTAKASTAKSATKVAAKPAAVPTQTTKAESSPRPEQENSNTENQSSTNKQKESLGKIIAMGAAAVAAGMIALYKLVFSAGLGE